MSPNSVSSTDKYVTSASSFTGHVYNNIDDDDNDNLRTNSFANTGRIPFVPTILPSNDNGGTTTEKSFISTTYKQHPSQLTSQINYSSQSVTSSPTPRSISSTMKTISSSTLSGNIIHQDNYERSTSLPSSTIASSSSSSSSSPSLPESLNVLLRREGLFAMAKYLRQSGLDNVLNETGKFFFSFH